MIEGGRSIVLFFFGYNEILFSTRNDDSLGDIDDLHSPRFTVIILGDDPVIKGAGCRSSVSFNPFHPKAFSIFKCDNKVHNIVRNWS